MWLTHDSVRVLRLDDATQRAVYQRLSEIEARGGGTRELERFRYTVPEGLDVVFEHPGGTNVKVTVASRDIAACGLSVLHGGFVYPQTRCTVRLKARDGEFVLVSGRVVRCRCISGRVHEVGVKFDENIEVALFVGQS